MPGKIVERNQYIDAAGVVYQLESISGSRSVISDEGSGLPPIRYITEHGPDQHGENIRDYFLEPRTVQFLIRQNFCSRQAAWDGRQSLLNAIRPNKTGGPQGVLRRILPNGEKRDLRVVPVLGPNFEPAQIGRWDEWSFQEILRFTAYNPIYYNPVVRTATIGSPASGQDFAYTFPFYFAVPSELVFPAEFPISFYEWNYAVEIDYRGTWQEYPTITIDGPAGPYVRITNETTGEQIVLSNLVIPDGDTVTIALAYGSQLVTNIEGENLLSHASGDLATFHLEPGSNTIRAILRSGGDATVVITYLERFIGI